MEQTVQWFIAVYLSLPGRVHQPQSIAASHTSMKSKLLFKASGVTPAAAGKETGAQVGFISGWSTTKGTS